MVPCSRRKFFGPAGQSADVDDALPTLAEMLLAFELVQGSQGDTSPGPSSGGGGPTAASATFGPMRKAHTNPVGGLHGGFQATMVERLATRLVGRSDVRSMQMTYYRESKHKLKLEAEIMGISDAAAGGAFGGSLAGPAMGTGTGVRVLLNNEKKGVMSQGFVQFGEGLSQGSLPENQ